MFENIVAMTILILTSLAGLSYFLFLQSSEEHHQHMFSWIMFKCMAIVCVLVFFVSVSHLYLK